MKLKFEPKAEQNGLALQKRSHRRVFSLRAFTLVELLIAISIIAVLAALGVGFMGRGREQARRLECDTKLKAIALALDAFRQENGRYPSQLDDLATRKYLQASQALKCPSDTRPNGSYAEGYVLRAPREDRSMGEVPMVLCPHHEEWQHGAQVYNARYTKQFAVAPAKLGAANDTTVERPDGQGPISGTSGMVLHGGDRVRAGGGAVIEFADGTTCTLQNGSDVTVLQSFLEGNGNAPLYSIVRQTLGRVAYKVNRHGSKFDVTTPTATAGARGTEFVVDVAASGDTKVLLLSQSALFVSTPTKSGQATPNQEVTVIGGVLGGAVRFLGGILGGLL